MKKYLVAMALAAVALAQPAVAITFPSLTTIYVASGVYDDGSADSAGFATAVHCSNVSGQSAQVRYLFLSSAGQISGNHTLTIPHGGTRTVATHGTNFGGTALDIPSAIIQGVLNVESTQSGVFCSAMIVEAVVGRVYGIPLHMVRINPHPGAGE